MPKGSLLELINGASYNHAFGILDRGLDVCPADKARDNIKRLLAAGVPVTIGTDSFRQDAHVEAERLAALGLMTNREILESWTMTTPRAIFPERNVGRFSDGAEASFLVLAGDPLLDLTQTRRIVRWIKQGVPLSPPDVKLPPAP